jgi:hypothetical protein
MATLEKDLVVRSGEAAAAPARKLVTLRILRAADLVLLSTRPCRGLALLSSRWHASAYHVFNLSTGEHVSLPTPAHGRLTAAGPGAPGSASTRLRASTRWSGSTSASRRSCAARSTA